MSEFVDESDPFYVLPSERPGGSAAGAAPRRNLDRPPIANLADLWDDETEPFEPTMLEVEGGKPLIYPGCSHLFFGTGGSGKSGFTQHAAVEVMAAGGVVLYLDYENSARNLVGRMKALGATREMVGDSMGYWRINEDLGPWVRAGLGLWLSEHPGVFVVLDGVSKSLAAAGHDEDKAPQVNVWDEQVPVPITEGCGATLSMIDHVSKPPREHTSGTPSAAELFPRGSGAKINNVTGAAYLFRATKPWSKTTSGWAEVWCAKDREGVRRQVELAAKCEVIVDPEAASMRFRVYAPTPAATTDDGLVRRTWYMEQVSRALDEQDGPMSLRALETDVGGNKGYIGSAIEVLRAEGFISSAKGKPLVLDHPYFQDDDPLAEGSTAGKATVGEPF